MGTVTRLAAGQGTTNAQAFSPYLDTLAGEEQVTIPR
jgi:hypothetical protein